MSSVKKQKSCNRNLQVAILLQAKELTNFALLVRLTAQTMYFELNFSICILALDPKKTELRFFLTLWTFYIPLGILNIFKMYYCKLNICSMYYILYIIWYV